MVTVAKFIWYLASVGADGGGYAAGGGVYGRL